MWDEIEDNKLREAADHYHPAYDKEAWEKMQQMLDKELPQKKDRRKFILFMPFILLLGGGVYFVMYHNNPIHSAAISQVIKLKNDVQILPVNTLSNKSNIQLNTLPVANITTKNTANASIYSFINKHTIQKNIHTRSTSFQKSFLQKNKANKGFTEEKNTSEVTGNVDNFQTVITTGNEIKKLKNDLSIGNQIPSDTSITVKDTRNSIQNDTASKKTSVKKPAEKIKNSFSKNFGITFSSGLDISGVRLEDAGKITVSYGAGLSYTLSKKITLRTGLYVSKKIYSTNKYDYHLPPNQSNTFLDKIDANCNVYEIPLSVAYNFKQTKNHKWFASAGLSTYLMKKEFYNYYYKYASGQTYNTDWTIRNKNNYYFSILNLSSGYEYMFNNHYSIAAEPYINVPLTGIGAGKIKLNSGGLLFTLTVKPFKTPYKSF